MIADFYSMLEVMTGQKDGCLSFLLIGSQKPFQTVLTRWVQKIKGLIQNEKLGPVDHCADNADLLFVSCREIPDKFFLSDYFITHEAL